MQMSTAKLSLQKDSFSARLHLLGMSFLTQSLCIYITLDTGLKAVLLYITLCQNTAWLTKPRLKPPASHSAEAWFGVLDALSNDLHAHWACFALHNGPQIPARA